MHTGEVAKSWNPWVCLLNSGLASNVTPYSHVYKSDMSHFCSSIDVFTLDLLTN